MSDVFDGPNAGPAVQEVDRLLRDFYQAELPAPWPRLVLPTRLPARPVARSARRPFFRLALAASVALALVSYWTVAGQFPDAGKGRALHGPEVAHNPLRHRPRVLQQAPLPPTASQAPQSEDVTPGSLPLPLVGPSTGKGVR